ncbi:uncharacterized protein OCT59_006223 [Rhizophagus irregularis]|uniref:uncharacterized protein n=1 Tax=Rhizophagus irregularis TaxID=588596 RepID=UPI003333E21B|nr:hypothetical protein OCT59_006223 [Rhizophagus irregularis]
MIQNRKNKNTEKGLASDNRNKTITNINKTQTTNINKNSSNTQQPSAAPSHERAQSVKERYKNLRLPDSSNTQPPSAAPSRRATSPKCKRDIKIFGFRSDIKLMNLPAMMMMHQQNNEFLAGVNAEFGSENNDLKEEVNELKTKLEQYQIRSSSESLDFIDVPEERLAKRFKSDGSKKVKKTVHYAENQPKEEQEEQREKEARIEMKMILKTIKPNDNLDDNETFNSPKNVEIRSRLIPELRRAMFPNYKPS